MSKKCRDCKWYTESPWGNHFHCGHPSSPPASTWGNLASARGDETSLCGPDGKLWESGLAYLKSELEKLKDRINELENPSFSDDDNSNCSE